MSAGSRLASCLVLAFAFAFAFAACTDDFDSLFKNGGAADASTGADGGGGTSGGACSSPASCTCGPGATCNTSCDADGKCNASANDGNLTYACGEHVDSCVVGCNGRSSCDVLCDAEGTCSMTCADDASCVLRCTARPTSCNLTCNEGVRKDCGNGVFTCSQSCP